MLKMSEHKDSLEKLPESDLKENEIMERYNLQKAIVNSWEAFTSEIGMPELYLIGQEIKPHDSVRDSIDILAFDANDNIPVVVELKRNKDKLQLLQAVTYAAMASSWKAERFVHEARAQNVINVDDLADAIGEREFDKHVRIILVAERFDPEVIITADWLLNQFKVDITAFGIDVFKKNDEIYLSFNQKFPLAELHESYEVRTSRRNGEKSETKLTWEEVTTNLKYPWGRSAIQTFQKIKTGNPDLRRFANVRTNFDGFEWISINMRREYVNVYIKGFPENGEQLLKSEFREPISVLKWRDGYSFHIKTQNQYEDLLKWLEIEPDKSKRNKVA